MIVVICSLLYLLSLLVLLVVCVKDGKRKYYVKAKMTVSSLFVIFSVIYYFCGNQDIRIVWASFPALLLCWCGDLFLGLYQKKHKKKMMLLGIGAFAVAHIFLCLYLFMRVPGIGFFEIVGPVLAIGATTLMMKVFKLHTGKARVPVIIYSAFVTEFMIKAVHIMFSNVNGGIVIGLAGILFWLSDLSLLFIYFAYFKKRWALIVLHVFNLASYFIAVYLMAFSLFT